MSSPVTSEKLRGQIGLGLVKMGALQDKFGTLQDESFRVRLGAEHAIFSRQSLTLLITYNVRMLVDGVI